MKEEKNKEFKKVLDVITENYEYGNCGIYNNRNWCGDAMTTIFAGKYFTVDICYYYSYFEVFGMTKKEFETLKSYYDLQKKDVIKDGSMF